MGQRTLQLVLRFLPKVGTFALGVMFEHNRRTQLLLNPTLNVAFKSVEPGIGEPFPNEKLFAR